MKKLHTLYNGSYVLAWYEDIVLAYNVNNELFETCEIDEHVQAGDYTSQTIQECTYYINKKNSFSTALTAAVDCFCNRTEINASSDHKVKLIDIIKWQIFNYSFPFVHIEGIELWLLRGATVPSHSDN